MNFDTELRGMGIAPRVQIVKKANQRLTTGGQRIEVYFCLTRWSFTDDETRDGKIGQSLSEHFVAECWHQFAQFTVAARSLFQIAEDYSFPFPTQDLECELGWAGKSLGECFWHSVLQPNIRRIRLLTKRCVELNARNTTIGLITFPKASGRILAIDEAIHGRKLYESAQRFDAVDQPVVKGWASRSGPRAPMAAGGLVRLVCPYPFNS